MQFEVSIHKIATNSVIYITTSKTPLTINQILYQLFTIDLNKAIVNVCRNNQNLQNLFRFSKASTLNL